MFSFTESPVPVRADLRCAYMATWGHFARPGPTLTGRIRIDVLEAARRGATEESTEVIGLPAQLGRLADRLYHDPISVDGVLVRDAADAHGDPMTVEVISLISMLSSIDSTHRALGSALEPLPEPMPGLPTEEIAADLKPRRTHIPVPPGAINVMFDLLPMEGAAFQALFGPQYMTGWEMSIDRFQRNPGLNRAQMELVSSRTSVHNECFY